MNDFYDREDEQNVADYWASLKDQDYWQTLKKHNPEAYWEALRCHDAIVRDSQGRPALQDEARWTWHQTEVALRAVVRGDLELWEDEQEAWWANGCR